MELNTNKRQRTTMELDRDTIQTTVQDGQILQSVYNNSPINFSTIISEVPQLQTVIQDNMPSVTSVVEAPWVAVTSVNGMTGDVITKASIDNFAPNTYYLKNTLTVYRRKLYFANETFTSGTTFNNNDWTEVSSSGGITDITSEDETVTVTINAEVIDLSIAETLEGYVEKEDGKGLSSNDYTTQEKTKLGGIASGAQKNVQSDWDATSGDAFIKNKPTIPTVNNATLTIQKNGSSVGTFTANASANKTINITTSQANWAQTSTTAEDYIKNKPTNLVHADQSELDPEPETPWVTNDMIAKSSLTFGNYSFTEKDTGFVWVDGKHIYQKTINFGALPNINTKSVPTGVIGLDKLIRFEGIALSGTTELMLPYLAGGTDQSVNVGMGYLMATNEIRITTGSNRSNYTECYITIYYTKTT